MNLPVGYASPEHRRSRFAAWHAVVALFLWCGASALTLAVTSMMPGATADRSTEIVLATASVALGPMSGAVTRDFQDCCLKFSLLLLPPCLGALIGAVVVQLLVPPQRRLRRSLRAMAWLGGLLLWFGGAIISLGHAIS